VTSSTRTHRANNNWLDVPSDEQQAVSLDRKTITGKHEGGTNFEELGYKFFQDSTYTITRVK
jgi:hypothetical protein